MLEKEQYLTGKIIIETPNGRYTGEIMRDGILANGSPAELSGLLSRLASLPVSLKKGRYRQGESPATVAGYERRCQTDPIFAVISHRVGLTPEAMLLTNRLRKEGICTLDAFLNLSPEEIMAIPGLGRGKRGRKVLTVQRSLKQPPLNGSIKQ